MIVGFHNIVDEPKSKWEVSPEHLAECIRDLAISEQEIEIHFDDARSGVYEYALPLLSPFLKIIKATVFVVPYWVEGKVPKHESYSRFMSWEELRILKKAGFEIGSHTMSHPNLTMCNEVALDYELRESKIALEKKLQCKVEKLAYPYGCYNQQVIDCAKKHYKYAYGINDILVGGHDWNIPRRLMISK